jgi:hypothetical protein
MWNTWINTLKIDLLNYLMLILYGKSLKNISFHAFQNLFQFLYLLKDALLLFEVLFFFFLLEPVCVFHVGVAG